MLNPDGAKLYTRLNANQSIQIEILKIYAAWKQVLRRSLLNQTIVIICTTSVLSFELEALVNQLQCLSLPFSAEVEALTSHDLKLSTLFLALILFYNGPNQVGRFWRFFFNINHWDTFKRLSCHLLFEAGHSSRGSSKEETRKYVFMSLASSLIWRKTDRLTTEWQLFKLFLKIKCFFLWFYIQKCQIKLWWCGKYEFCCAIKKKTNMF
jgi:hypothetical protein